jgi:hypothetical protein
LKVGSHAVEGVQQNIAPTFVWLVRGVVLPKVHEILLKKQF